MRRLHFVVLGALTSWSAGLSTTARAAEITIALDCPALDQESRAALESRARAELIVRDAQGTLVVVCHAQAVDLTWHSLASAPSTAVAIAGADPRASIENILEALDVLLTTPPSTVTGDRGGGALPTPTATAPAPPAPVVTVAPPAAAVSPPARDESRVAERATRPIRFGAIVTAGATGELWSGTAALGPHVSAGLPLPARFTVHASGAILFALSSPGGVNGRLARAAVGGDFAIDPSKTFRVGVEALVDVLHADAAGAGSDDKAVFGGRIRATAELPLGALTLRAGPTLAAHPGEIQVALGSTPAFHLPLVTGGLEVELSAGPW